MPYGEAAYALMRGIDTSEKVSAKKQLIDAQKKLYEMIMQINMVKQILAPKRCCSGAGEIASFWYNRGSNLEVVQND